MLKTSLGDVIVVLPCLTVFSVMAMLQLERDFLNFFKINFFVTALIERADPLFRCVLASLYMRMGGSVRPSVPKRWKLMKNDINII